MLQQNSFFSQASIFFGPNIEFDEEIEEYELETTQFALDTEFTKSQEPQIGLFIDWCLIEDD